MAQQASDAWTADDFAAATDASEGWTAEDFDEPQQQTVPQGIAGAYRGIGHALAGGALEGLSSMAGYGGKVIDYMGGTQPASPGGARPLPGGVQAPAYSEGPQIGAQLLGPPERALRQAGQEIYPQAEREQQGLPGQVMYTAGQMASAGPAVALGPPAAAFAFAAQNAMPAYYDVLAKTGSEEKANQALWINSAIGQLEFLGGGEKLAGSILKKLVTGEVGQAIKNTVLRMTMTQGAEVGTELAQTGLSDLLYEHLTGEDLQNWERLKQTAPVALLASAPFVVVDAALSAGPSQPSRAAPGAQQEPGAQQAIQPTEPAPVAPVEPQKAQATEQLVGAAPGPEVEEAAAGTSEREVAATRPPVTTGAEAAAEGTVPQAGAEGEMVIESPGVTERSAMAVKNQETATKKGHVYRGMTEAEYGATIGSGKAVQSRKDFSFAGEGTSFAEDFPTASSYVNFGRDDPRKTGKPTYVVEIESGPNLRKNRQGYYEAHEAVPSSQIRRRWRVEARGNDLVAVLLSEAAPAAAGSAQVSIPEQSETDIGIKNRVVERELEEMGVELPEKEARGSFVDLHARAKQTLEKDQRAGERLVAELATEERQHTDEEGALLTMEANRLRLERKAAEEAYIQDPSQANEARIKKAREDFAKLAEVTQETGGKVGAALNIRKMMVKEDYSLAGMERAMAVARGGELTKQELARVKELQEKLDVLEKAHKKYVTDAELRRAQLQAEVALAREGSKLTLKGRRKTRQASIEESKREIDRILNELAKGHKAAAGLDPGKIALTAKLAFEHIKIGYQNFAQWADEVVARVGEHIRPYLRPAWDAAQAEHSKKMLGAYKARKKTDIAKLEERQRRKDFESMRRQTPVEQDPEAVALKAQYERTKKTFEFEKKRAERAKRSKAKKLLDAAKGTANVPRAINFSFDLAPVFRQGKFFGVNDLIFNPARLTKQVWDSTMALSQAKADKIDAKLRSGKWNDMAEIGGLDLPTMEEEMSGAPEILQKGLASWSRTMNTFLNLQRMAHFSVLMDGISGGKPTIAQAKAAARAINILTGRGNAKGKVASAMDALGPVLSSPRLLLSNVQTMVGAPAFTRHRAIRNQIIKQYAKHIAARAVIHGLVALLNKEDDEIRNEWNWRSSDFGKIMAGEKRYDLWGGMSQIANLAGRTITGENKDPATGKIKSIRGEKKKFTDRTWSDFFKEFWRYKLAPVPAAMWDIAEGTQVERDKRGRPLPTTAGSVAKNLLLPITLKDIYSESVRQGVPATLADKLVGAFAVGVRDYSK